MILKSSFRQVCSFIEASKSQYDHILVISHKDTVVDLSSEMIAVFKKNVSIPFGLFQISLMKLNFFFFYFGQGQTELLSYFSNDF